jgi:mRNA interferase RelE/StbE
LAWKIELDASAEKALGKLGAPAARRIIKGLREIAVLEDSTVRGKPMSGNYAGYWRYRFGDYRAIARIVGERLVIVVIAVGHRREVYD